MKDRFPSISRFFQLVEDATGSLHPFYARNFRELIKLIPVLGSWLDANTVGAIDDRLLEGRLQELETACAAVLKKDDLADAVDDILRVNALLFHILARHLSEMLHSNRELLLEIRSFLAIPHHAISPLEPNPKLLLVTLSGPSAVGKDVMLDLLAVRSFPQVRRCETLTKLTTRPKRAGEHRYYRFCTEQQFQSHLSKDRVLFPYHKREHHYGFDKQHLFNLSRSEVLLFAVFTEFEMLPRAREFLLEQGVRTLSILLEAPEEHLIQRSWFRAFPESEVKSRVTSIRRDLSYIVNDAERVKSSYDHVVYNGDDRAKLDTAAEIEAAINAALHESRDSVTANT